MNKAKTLLKLLALAPLHRANRDRVVDMLWPGADMRATANNIHQLVHAVRRTVGPGSIQLHHDTIALGPDGLTVDVDLFEQAAAIARASGDVAALQRALELWTGELLPEDPYAEWAAEHRQRLTETHAALVFLMGTLLLTVGQPENALVYLEPLAANRPLDERLHRLLIELLAVCGRRWDAIEAYERLREALDEAFAGEPEPPTRALYRRVLTGNSPTPTNGLHNLPASSTSFIGRRQLLAELARILERTRLMSLTGVGGVGKSRLAVELARQVTEGRELPDGAWLVELAGIQDPEIVSSTCAAALRLTLRSGGSPAEVLAGQLADRALLLVIDNCEHLLGGVAPLVIELLKRCPDVVILTTSREPLAVPGELVYRVPCLELPSPGTNLEVRVLSRLEAVQLFVERARSAEPSFTLNVRTAAAVAQICRRLDGIPLALELAAARLAHFTVQDLAAGLDDSLSLLRRPGHGTFYRQQTLAATLDWSHGLLTRDEQLTFRRLAVFAGGFDSAAAASVCEIDSRQATAVISRLVDKSLVQPDTDGSTTRYQLLEVVRQYAQARLSEAAELEDCRRRHLRWYAQAVAVQDPDRGAAVVGEPSGWFDMEKDNLRVAFSTAVATDPTVALQLATATWRFWVTRGLIDEGAWWLDRALDGCVDRSALRARALSARSVLFVRQGRPEALSSVGDEIVDLLEEFGDPDQRVHARHQQALLTFMAGDWRTARVQNAETLNRSHRLPAVAGSAHHFAGVLALGRGEIGDAEADFATALKSLDQVPDDAAPFFVAVSVGWVVDERHNPPLPFGEETVLFGHRLGKLQAVGDVRIAMALAGRLAGRPEESLSTLDEAAALFRSLGDRYGESYALAQRGHTLRWIRQYEEADRYLRQSEELRRDLRDRRAVAMAVLGRALTAAAAGKSGDARRLGLDALAMMERSGDTAGFTVAGINIAVTEMLSGDLAAALSWLDRSLARFPIPGGHRSLGWLQLLRANALWHSGESDDAGVAIAAAQETFVELGEQCGSAAVQRMRKEHFPTLGT